MAAAVSDQKADRSVIPGESGHGKIPMIAAIPHCHSSSDAPIGIVALMPKEATPDKANAPAQVMKA
jgi:hypothetical protein